MIMRKKNAMAGARKADAAELKNLKAKIQPCLHGQEMEAMNQLKSEPGLRGRLARKGARKKINFVDGVPAFYDASTGTEEAEADYSYGTSASPGLDNPIRQIIQVAGIVAVEVTLSSHKKPLSR